MNQPPDPNATADLPSAPVDSLDAGLAAGFGKVSPPRSTLANMRPVLLKEVEGESAHIVKPMSDAMPPREETGDRYHLSGEIARGGMGAVLRGRDNDLGRDLAVKVLLEKYAGRPEVIRRFIEEAQIGGQLQHPGVVPVYDVGRFGDRPFFAMKLVKGQTLAAILSERSDLMADAPRLLNIGLQVTQTLAYAHAKGVIHRDLKPANIMVGAFGEVQVMDWGLAKVLAGGGIADEERASRAHQERPDETTIRTLRSSGSTGSFGTDTEAGSLLGTPAYMPPEQANGDNANLDRRADVFGLGAILCEILTGKPPYVGRSYEEVRRKAANGDLADALARLDACGADAELIVLTKSCLSPETSDRPKDAQSVADGLTTYLNGVQERLHAAQMAEAEAKAKAVEEIKRRRLTLALAATVLLAFTFGGGGWLWVKGDRDARVTLLTRDVNEALNRAIAFHEQAKLAPVGSEALFNQAREQAQRALALVENGPADEVLVTQVQRLQAVLDEDERDRKLIAALDEARLAEAETLSGEGRFARELAVPLFREAFRAYGLPVGELEPKLAAERIRQKPAAVREAIVATLDEWNYLAGASTFKIKEPYREWLQEVLELAEAKDAWSQRVRAASKEQDVSKRKAALEKLAESTDVATVPAPALLKLSLQLKSAPGIALLRRAYGQYPADFWVNQYLGFALGRGTPSEVAESVRFLTAAVALRPSSPGAVLNLGTALRDQGQLDEAFTCFKKAIKFAPNFAMAHQNLGDVLRQKGQLDEAFACFRKAIGLAPSLAMAHNGMGYTLMDKKEADEAVACYRKAIELAPKYANAHNGLGNALMAKGQVKEAIASYKKAIEFDPKDPNPHSNLGTALIDKGQLKEAIACYKKAIELDPRMASSHSGLGFALSLNGQLDEAIACCRKAIELDPKYSMAHGNLVAALKAKGQFDEAIASYRKASECDPNNPVYHNDLGALLNERCRFDEAIACYRRAIELDSTKPAFRSNLGNALLAKGELDKAIACYRKAIELDPKFAIAHDGLGNALLGKGQVEEGMACYRKAIEVDPKFANAHTDLGNALWARGQVDNAVACYRKAIELDPTSAIAHSNLGVALSHKGELDEAIACFRKVIKLDPKYPRAHGNLVDALKAKGLFDEAIICFKKAIDFDPKDPNYQNDLGALLNERAKFDEAIACYRKAIELDSTKPAFHSNLGNALLDKGEVDKAIASHHKAIELDPKFANAHDGLGNALLTKGQVEEAIACYRKAIELDPRNANTHNNLGTALKDKGQLEEAITSYRHSIELSPRFALAVSNLAKAEILVKSRAKLPAFQNGSYTPATNEERLGLVEWCKIMKLHRTATSLYSNAFAADPKLADDLESNHRYNAACYAALAAAGQGEDAGKLDDKERMRLRQLAFDWLRADLASRSKQLQTGKPGDRTVVQQTLRFWQKDTDLAGLRDAAPLAKLPAEEQKALAQLWADVNELSKKATENPQ